MYDRIALIIWLIPLGLFALLALTHKRGFMAKAVDKLATAGMGGALGLAVYLLTRVWGAPYSDTAGISVEWFRFAVGKPVHIGILVDNLAIVMLCVVTLVSFLVHLFSIGYMRGDARYGRYFCGLLLFSQSMILLVLSDNLLTLYMGWELVGMSSYILIGHWFEKKSAADAAMKAFITTRIGDVGMFLGILIIYWQVGSFNYADVFAAVADGGLSGNWRTLAGIGLFFGAIGKSAQFPLHVWLPDAMEGPTPVSALIHAATMVAAGVFMVGRLYPLFDSPTFLFIAYTGAITAFMPATIALVQDDIKKVLAYSTISQLGYMMLALGVGGYVSGLFHLTTHACFKACLFLGSGSVIHAMHHEQRMSQYGGLFRKMKITGLTFLAACLAISGFPFIASGFYSKDAILADALAFFLREGHSVHWLLPTLGFGTAFLTAFYMFRQFYLTFAGKPRNAEKHHHAHESPWTMTVPLIVLGVLSIVAGGFHFGFGHHESWFEKMNPPSGAALERGATLQSRDSIFPPASSTPAGELHAPNAATDVEEAAHGETAAPHHDPVKERAHHLAMQLSIVLALGGILLATLFYWRGLTHAPEKLAAAFPRLHRFLWNKWYFDELYYGTVVRATVIAGAVSFAFDKYVIDGLVNLVGHAGRFLSWLAGLIDLHWVDGLVNGLSYACQRVGAGFGRMQTGRLRTYLAGLTVGAAVVAVIMAALL